LRQIARRFALNRRAAATAAAALATITTLAVLGPASALAAGPPVKVTTSYGLSRVSVSTSDSIGFAIANTTANGTAQTNFSFTDTLPAGVALDLPISLTTNAPSTPLKSTATGNPTASCGSVTATNPATGVTSAPGDTTVTITIGSLPATTTAGTVCTIALGIVAAAPSVNDAPLFDSYNSAPTSFTAAPAGLVVLSNPTLSFLAPTKNQTFSLGQISHASFNCAVSDPLDAVDAFFGTDDEGNEIQSGAPIDTIDPGAHSLAVDCYSAVGGGDVTQTVNYRVKSYTLTAIKSTKTDQVSFQSKLPAGKIVAEVLDGKKVVGTTKVTLAAKKTVTVTVKPSTAGKKVLAATKGNKANVKLDVSFTPKAIGSGDTKIVASEPTEVIKSLKVAIAKPAKK
jgi:hypothetical protein